MGTAERGSPYARPASQALVAAHGSSARMRRPGACLEHAVAERCLGRRKRAGTAPHRYATRPEARADMLASIALCDNRRRPHAPLGYVSPNLYATERAGASLGVRFRLTTTLMPCGLRSSPTPAPRDGRGGAGLPRRPPRERQALASWSRSRRWRTRRRTMAGPYGPPRLALRSVQILRFSRPIRSRRPRWNPAFAATDRSVQVAQFVT